MIKDIKLNGLSAVPADNIATDGDLDLAINLHRPIAQIEPLLHPHSISGLPAGLTPLIIHKTGVQSNLIFSRPATHSTVQLLWALILDDGSVAEPFNTIDDSSPLIRQVSVTGNALIAASEAGLLYFLWKDGKYISLGNSIPHIPISFGLQEVQVTDTTVHTGISVPITIIPNIRGDNFRVKSHPSSAHLEKLYNNLLARLLPFISSDVSSQGYFYQPFFLRYAIKLYDGTYTHISAPVLMLPTVDVPLITLIEYFNGGASDDDGYRVKAGTSLINVCRLVHYIQDAISSEWENIIDGIDVFVSPIIYTYRQNEVYRYGDMEASQSELYKSTNMFFHSTEGDLKGHYGSLSVRGRPIEIDGQGSYCEHFYSSGDSDSCLGIFRLPRNEKFEDDLKSVSRFYLIAEIPFKDIVKNESGNPLVLKLKEKDLTNLQTFPALTDDSLSHSTLIPDTIYSYNNRLAAAVTKVIPPEPFSIATSIPFTNVGTMVPCDIAVWIKTNGQTVIAHHKATVPDFPLAEYFPRYLYYPHAGAFKMQLRMPSMTFTIPLTPHDFLSGAYYYAGIAPNVRPEPDTTLFGPPEATTVISQNTVIYLSEPNNPFLLTSKSTISIGNAEVTALSTAAKALSQGQFGQFPMYAFSDEGVWAVEIASDGSFSVRQPITRDVCINPQAICQLDSSVLFPTRRGIMMLSGADTQCITDTIATDTPFQLQSLPAFQRMFDMMDTSDAAKEQPLDILPFSDFLARCRMLYDYTHQRVIVYAPSVPYAYIFSLRTRTWTMMQSHITQSLNSYPEAFAIVADPADADPADGTIVPRLVDYSRHTSTPYPGLLLTRPLNLDAPDILKTVDTVILRGNFAKSHVALALWGSRDLIHWHLVHSSTTHILHGFRGTPYKYFRLAALCRLAPGETIASATISYTPRYTNRLR